MYNIISDISLLKNKTENEKLDIARKIGNIIINYQVLTRSEIKGQEILIKELVQDKFISVRRLIIDKIKEYPIINKDISLLIIKDVEEISCSFIEKTKSLDNNSWIDIYYSLSLNQKISLSKRKDLNSEVQNLLISEKNNKITYNVVFHSNHINEYNLNEIIHNNEQNSIIIHSISERNDLTINIINNIYSKVSNNFKLKLEEKLYDLINFSKFIKKVEIVRNHSFSY